MNENPALYRWSEPVSAFSDMVQTWVPQLCGTNKIKNEQTILRKSFLDIIQDITPELHKKIILNIDTLTDELTNVISNDEFKLCNSKTYEREIHTRIQNSDKYVLNQIFNYRG